MKPVRRALTVILCLLIVTSGPPIVYAQGPTTTEQQGEFVPAGDLPQRELVPAAPLLIGAYSFVMLALFGYVFSVARRVGAVKADIARLEAEVKRGSRG